MKESYWGYWLVILGIFIVAVMMLTQSATTLSTQDYYQLKEAANSSIYDSIDYSYFTQTHEVRIIKEVFVENFLRRFAQGVNATSTYQVDFFDLYESPPKVSIKITTKSNNIIIAKDSTSLDVVNSIDLIVEFNETDGISEETGMIEDEGDQPVIEACDYYTGE